MTHSVGVEDREWRQNDDDNEDGHFMWLQDCLACYQLDDFVSKFWNLKWDYFIFVILINNIRFQLIYCNLMWKWRCIIIYRVVNVWLSSISYIFIVNKNIHTNTPQTEHQRKTFRFHCLEWKKKSIGCYGFSCFKISTNHMIARAYNLFHWDRGVGTAINLIRCKIHLR